MIISPKYATPVFKKDQPDDSYKFQPLPPPPGIYPYHLNVKDILPGIGNNRMVFHVVGDTGGFRDPDFQKRVPDAMASQYQTSAVENKPSFLYHLGDVVYSHGEEKHYKSQFFDPYANYPGPVFAIAGNHDSDVNPAADKPYQSLEAFTAVFCDTQQRPIAFAGDSPRKSMVQPNIYWRLDTPLATIIGLHSNVPKYGVITPEQRDWFLQELLTSVQNHPEKALLVCIHHSPYSADVNHGSSLPMIEFLEGAFSETDVWPDMVFSGHVHNYQRINKRYANGIIVPYIVAGAGGFDELHPVAHADDERFSTESYLLDNTELVSLCDTQHGFIKVTLQRTDKGLSLATEYYAIDGNRVALMDSYGKIVRALEK